MGKECQAFEMFGFWRLFGFYCSGSRRCRIKTLCSVCSVDFVEKMWESLWENWWKVGGKVSTFLTKWWFSTRKRADLHIIQKIGESFPGGFTQEFPSVKWGFCTVSTEPITTITNILERKKNGD